jgi:transcriptional regulator with XRE-family HTH domain
MPVKQLENCYKTSASCRKYEQNQVVKLFGMRMKEARELCNMTQIVAAKRLGYSNSSKLAKIESASDTNSIPLWVVTKAARIYDVSVSFLLDSDVDDWERDIVVSQQRVIGAWLFDHWERAKVAEVNAIRVLQNKLSTIEKTASRMLKRSKENLEAIEKVRELNEEFDDLRGGARLLRLLTETAEDAAGLSYELKKMKAFAEVAKADNVNLDIFKDDD